MDFVTELLQTLANEESKHMHMIQKDARKTRGRQAPHVGTVSNKSVDRVSHSEHTLVPTVCHHDDLCMSYAAGCSCASQCVGAG